MLEKMAPVPLVVRSEFLIDLSLYTYKITSTLWLLPAVFRTDTSCAWILIQMFYVLCLMYKIHSINMGSTIVYYVQLQSIWTRCCPFHIVAYVLTSDILCSI